MGSLESVAAATTTASAPRPRVKRRTSATGDSSPSTSAASAPRSRASRTRAGIPVEGQDGAAVGPEELDHELPDDAEPDHDDALPEGRPREPHALERDGPQRGEGRFLRGMGVPSGRAGTGTHRVRGTQTTSAWTA